MIINDPGPYTHLTANNIIFFINKKLNNQRFIIYKIMRGAYLNKLIVVNPSKLNMNILSFAATMRDNPNIKYARGSDDVAALCRKYSRVKNTFAAVVYNTSGYANTKQRDDENTSNDIIRAYNTLCDSMGSHGRFFIMSPPAEQSRWQEIARGANIHIKLTSAISPFIIDKIFEYTHKQKYNADIMKLAYNIYAGACSHLPYGKYLEYYKIEDQHKIRERVYPSMLDLSNDVNPTIHEYIEIMNYTNAIKNFRTGAYEFMHAYNNIEYTDTLFLNDPDGYIRLDVIMRGRKIIHVRHYSKIYNNFQEIKCQTIN